MSHLPISLKRVYDKPTPQDGVRILVDRLWPRGLSRDKAKIDLWLKDMAPSHELRKWFHGDRSRWKEFQERYIAELKDSEEALEAIIGRAVKGMVTLVYASRDDQHNNAAVLKDYLESRVLGRSGSSSSL